MYDLIIIGAGTAGISAYNEAIKYTQNILIINDGSWDTTCARVGCMPSKLLISSANRMHDIQTAEELALKHNAVIDTSDVMQRVHVLRERFIRATLKGVDQWDSSHKISGKAKFIDPQTIEVNGQSYRAKSFIVAVGSRPNIDETLKQQLKEKYITSNEIFEFSQLPKSLAVIGSGIIAIELAQAMQRLGVQTTMFARSQKVGALTSPILQKLAQEQLSKELNIKFKTLPDEIEIQADKIIKINFTENDQTKSIEVEYVLGATGRQSNIDRLGLDQLNSTFKDIKNLPIDKETKQLANLPIFIVGDAAPDAPIQHEAALTGKQVVHNCLNYPEVKTYFCLNPIGDCILSS